MSIFELYDKKYERSICCKLCDGSLVPLHPTKTYDTQFKCKACGFKLTCPFCGAYRTLTVNYDSPARCRCGSCNLVWELKVMDTSLACAACGSTTPDNECNYCGNIDDDRKCPKCKQNTLMNSSDGKKCLNCFSLFAETKNQFRECPYCHSNDIMPTSSGLTCRDCWSAWVPDDVGDSDLDKDSVIQPCPRCKKRDHVVRFSTGEFQCFFCKHKWQDKKNDMTKKKNTKQTVSCPSCKEVYSLDEIEVMARCCQKGIGSKPKRGCNTWFTVKDIKVGKSKVEPAIPADKIKLFDAFMSRWEDIKSSYDDVLLRMGQIDPEAYITDNQYDKLTGAIEDLGSFIQEIDGVSEPYDRDHHFNYDEEGDGFRIDPTWNSEDDDERWVEFDRQNRNYRTSYKDCYSEVSIEDVSDEDTFDDFTFSSD